MVKVSVIGATGYTGRELIRILSKHKEIKINSLMAKIDTSCCISDIFGTLKGDVNLKCKPFNKDDIELLESDLIFLAVPHGVSIELVYYFLDRGKKVIDLSADYRLDNIDDYKKWYNIEHSYPKLLEKAVYGLSEFNKENIKGAALIANPGCFPTSILLALLPLLDKISFDEDIIIDSKTGTSGAGRKASINLSFSEIDGDIKPYKINRHQHSIEINQQIDKYIKPKINNKNIIFVPHLVSFKRGILSTIYVNLKNNENIKKIKNCYLNCYSESKFVQFLDSAENVSVLNVKGTNKCHIGVVVNDNNLIIVSAIDNLVKGAAGQAVQNMNIMYGFDEELGLI